MRYIVAYCPLIERIAAMPFEAISDEQHAAFVSSLKSGQYNLLLGSGASMDSSNGKETLPSGTKFRNDIAQIKQANPAQPLQKLFSLLKPAEIELHVTKRFSNCTAGPTYLLLSTFIWKRAFTFNIDDAMEFAYERDAAKQTLLSYNFDDEYEDDRSLAELPLIHLHGDVTRPVAGYVFSREEYIRQITVINPWMTVLSQFIRSEPFIISGSSMDEVDLDFYLAHRTKTSARDDRGPSIRVEPFPDEVTRNDCERHGLLLFIGTALEFLHYCEAAIPHRPTPYELVPQESQKLMPEGVSKQVALSFLSDFELVPATERENSAASRFLYGHSPSWGDLASNADIPRPMTGALINEVESRLKVDSNEPRLLLIRESTGTGKTTVLRRCAFELAQRGVRVLNCSALSRVEPMTTASVIDLIDEPLVLIVDNFADQVTVFRDLLDRIEKKDVVIVAADRSYRFRYIIQALSGAPYSLFNGLPLRLTDCEGLIANYVGHGLVGSRSAIRNKRDFIKKIVDDPVAVACSRILNDFHPLDKIITDILSDSTDLQHRRYYTAALAQHCFRGGVRYAILSGAVAKDGLSAQLGRDHALPLAFFDRTNSFVVPQNSTLAQRVLSLASETDRDLLLEIFVGLANQIASWVNRKTLKRRSPEARLAGRLFDFDSVTDELLKDKAPEFYQRTQTAWQWNSRYWEQLALMHLAQYFILPNTQKGRQALTDATQHARHAVAIENHPLPLTTLGKILLVQMTVTGFSLAATYTEAYEHLTNAIFLEESWSRKAIQPYILLFRGTADYSAHGGALSKRQSEKLVDLVQEARNRWGHDSDMTTALEPIQALVSR
jgi:SIR2-like domain